MEWISIKDEMPPKNQEVWGVLRGCVSGKQVQRTITYVNECDHVFESDGFEIANCWDVTHWMPQPPMPEK